MEGIVPKLLVFNIAYQGLPLSREEFLDQFQFLVLKYNGETLVRIPLRDFVRLCNRRSWWERLWGWFRRMGRP